MKIIVIFALLLTSTYSQDFTSQKYQSQSRTDKLNQLWTQISQDQSSGSFPKGAKALELFTEDVSVSMHYQSDVFPDGRSKLIHSVGNTAKVKFVPLPNSSYTGIFRGADSGIIRLSVAKQYDSTKTSAQQAYNNFAPGFGLKFLRDGQPSANLVAMYSVDGISSWNFFDSNFPFTIHIGGSSQTAQNLLARKFSTATNIVTAVGISDFAQQDQNGKKENIPFQPYKLVFRPSSQVNKLFSSTFNTPFTTQLRQIKSGTTIYDVYAIEDPSVACEALIGSIVTQSELITSKFGDQKLFFRHQDANEDLLVHPEWKQYFNFYSTFWGDQGKKKKEGGCPMKRLFI